MRIVCDRQQTEEWDAWRNRPTASCFGQFVTPAKGQYSAQATAYAGKVVAKKLGVYTEPPPTFWMEWGTENEPNARHCYQKAMGRAVQEVGFIVPDNTDAYGGSPDGLVEADGMIEIKCPAPETLISYHAAGEMPVKYRPQVQGLLLISGREWCDFFAWHPELTPFYQRVMADEKYQTKIAEGLLLLLNEIRRIETKVRRVRHELIAPTKTNVKWDD